MLCFLSACKHTLAGIVISSSLLSCLYATQDLESKEDTLDILRVVLSQSAVLKDMAQYTSEGFHWKDENVWFGTELTAMSEVYPGGISLLFETAAGQRRWLSYHFIWDRKSYTFKDMQRVIEKH